MWPLGRGGAKDEPAGGLGAVGEKLAAAHLRRNGHKILARNYRCPAGEADLVTIEGRGEGRTIVFVEVKARRSDRHVDPESAVDSRKRRKLARVAEYYLAHHDAADCAVRFDVVSVVLSEDGPQIRHIADAFGPG